MHSYIEECKKKKSKLKTKLLGCLIYTCTTETGTDGFRVNRNVRYRNLIATQPVVLPTFWKCTRVRLNGSLDGNHGSGRLRNVNSVMSKP